MNSIDIIRMGSSNLFRRKLRTFLTTLGIVIGTISIIVMVSLGLGLKESYRRSMERMGGLDEIMVLPSRDEGGHSRRRKDNMLKYEDIEKLEEIEGVKAVTPYTEIEVELKSGRYITDATLVAMRADLIDDFGYEVSEGRTLNMDDENAVIFGSDVAFKFRRQSSNGNSNGDEMHMAYGGYGGYGQPEEEEKKKKAKVDVLKDRITFTFKQQSNQKKDKQDKKKIRPFKIEGVGILEENEADWYSKYNIYMSIDSLKEFKKKYDRFSGIHKHNEFGYEQIKVKVENIEDVIEIQDKIKEMGYMPLSMMSWAKENKKMTNIIQLIFGGIGAVALFVAAIGITNTMVMAIYERRKEIGVMKVVGASLIDIKRLFLFEASMIGFMGGIIGLALSFLASKGLNMLVISKLGDKMMLGPDTVISVVPIWLAAIGVVFTTIIGLISGYLPARKAMKLSALEAIRTE